MEEGGSIAQPFPFEDLIGEVPVGHAHFVGGLEAVVNASLDIM
jgi:hypothetical protein